MRNLLVVVFILSLFVPYTADAARLWSSGCELQGDAPGNMIDNLEWDREGGSADETLVSTTVKRTGLSSCRAVNSGLLGWGAFGQQFSSSAVSGDVFLRFYLYIATAPAENTDIALFYNGAYGTDEEGYLVLNSDRTLTWADDEGASDGNYATPLSTGTWYRIEINYDAADEVIVRLDGTEIINSGTHTGDNVSTFALGLCVEDFCGGDFETSGDLHFDDVAFNDTSGSNQTSWPGAGSIVHMQPDGAGDNSGCSAGDWMSIDEITPDDALTICTLVTDGGGDIVDTNVEASSSAGIDSYDTISLVQVGVRESAASAASESWNVRVKSASGGTTSSGTVTAHDDITYKTNGDAVPRNYTLTSYTDPTTAIAWTPTGTNSLDNMQIGIISVDGNPDIRVTTLWALIEYVDGSPPLPIINRGLFNAGRSIQILGGGLRIF